MTIRNLKYLFNPGSIAIIGKGNKPNSADALLVRNLISGGIKGPVMPVNPDRKALEGVLAYKDVASLPLPPELAVITTPLDTVPALIGELGALGTRAVVLLNDEMLRTHDNEGNELKQAMLDAAKPYLLRILGPDFVGMAVPKTGVNVILSETPVLPGNIAMLSQSAAVLRSVMDRATSRNIGFSHLLSVRSRVDVDFGDLLDYLAQDSQARAILVYLETILETRKFMSAARTAARIKPVIVLKPRSGHGSNPVGDAIYDAAFRRAGILRVRDIEGLFTAVESLDTVKRVYNNRLAILGNSHSIGLLACDDLSRGSSTGKLAKLSEATQQELAQIVPKGFPSDNPVDLGDQPDPKSYGTALAALLKEREVDGILVLHAPVSPAHDLAAAQAVIEQATKTRRFVLTCWLGSQTAEPARRFKEHKIATYATPTEAIQVFKWIAEHTQNQELLMLTPPSVPEEFEVDSEAARKIISKALAAGYTQLNPFDTVDLLGAYRIPAVETRLATTPEEAAAIAETLGGPVAIKIYSQDIAHKSDVGGVVFNVEPPAEVQETAAAILRRVNKLAPAARIDGFIVQPMLNRGSAYELTVGVRTGRHFGPVVFFGHGGTETEVINDIAYALPPLNMHLARELMSRTRIYTMLSDTPGRSADLSALALTLIKVSQMVIDLGEVVEIDINPLWISANKVIALDARIRIAEFTLSSPTKRLAIRPYPKELEQTIKLADGRALRLRPIMAEDEPAVQAMVRRADPEDLRLRFFQPIKELTHTMAARLTQLDYDREMAFAVTSPGRPGKADIWAVVRITADPDLEKGEYAILIDRQMTGLGLGPMLMRHIIDYARKRGIREIFGEVLRENKRMLKLNQALGFNTAIDPDDPALMRVSLKL